MSQPADTLRDETTMDEQGAVHSRQTLTMAWPATAPAPGAVTVGVLGPYYFARLPALTFGLIAVAQHPTGTRFLLRGVRLPLLCFGPPQLRVVADGGACRYPITGGWMVAGAAPPGAALALSLRRRAGSLQLSMIVEEYYPRIAGKGSPTRWRARLYRATQARLHGWIARRTLRGLAGALRAGALPLR